MEDFNIEDISFEFAYENWLESVPSSIKDEIPESFIKYAFYCGWSERSILNNIK